MTPTILPRGSREAGFTLVEVLVVLAVLSMAALFAVPAMRGQGRSVSTQRDVGELRGQLVAARAQAANTAAPVDVQLPEAYFYAPVVGSNAGQLAAVRFYPDGSSSGGEVLSDGRPILRINWLTGEVRGA